MEGDTAPWNWRPLEVNQEAILSFPSGNVLSGQLAAADRAYEYTSPRCDIDHNFGRS